MSTSGYSAGQYWPSQSSGNLFDGHLTGAYTKHGYCDLTVSATLLCGVNTGFYLTLNDGPFTLAGFYVGTENVDTARDPLTCTIEGSNAAGGSLPTGSSWTLIYNGSTGIDPDPGRNVYGALQRISIASPPFKSYRFLVTSVRGYTTCTSYTELVMFVY